MGSEHQQPASAHSCRGLPIETTECFICREAELLARDPLRHFCDCKNLLAHHVCLSTWIQKGCESGDRLRCIICKAKYELQRTSPWRSVSFQWQTWLMLITGLALMGLVPYVVHCMMTAFTRPPPPTTFKVAAASYGLLAEILLIKCLCSYLSGCYRWAAQNSFTIRARGPEEHRTSQGCCNRPEASAEAGHASSERSADESKEGTSQRLLDQQREFTESGLRVNPVDP
ncbi:uncharacterized protein ACO6RY_18990 [Pungitius sinensis]